MTRPDIRSHFASPDEMNWSNMICAPLAKSPNCASHSDQRVGLGERVAVLEAEHRVFREHRVDDLVARLPLADVVEREVALLGLLVDEGRSGAGVKVPRVESWPDRRTGQPSVSSEPKASASAVAQSKPSPVASICRLASSMRSTVLCERGSPRAAG